MPEKDNSEDRNSLNWSRRGILTKLGVAGGLTPVASTSRAAEVNKKDNPPKPYPDTDDPNSSYSRHVAEFDSRKRQLSRYESTGDPTELYGHELKQRLRENPDQSEFDVVVSTMGTRTSMRRERDGRTLYGFRPTQQEVVTLQSVGDVTYIGDIVSTKVCIRNVARRDLATVAHYPFVVEISPMAKNASLNSVSIENIVTDTWTRFTSAHGNYSVSDISIAIMEDGYDTSYQSYASNYAQDIGFDKSLSKDFYESGDPFTANDPSPDHAAKVADTAGYVLKDGDTHSDLFIALKIASFSDFDNDEEVRQGIEYATKKGIEVLNMSFGWGHTRSARQHIVRSLIPTLLATVFWWPQLGMIENVQRQNIRLVHGSLSA